MRSRPSCCSSCRRRSRARSTTPIAAPPCCGATGASRRSCRPGCRVARASWLPPWRRAPRVPTTSGCRGPATSARTDASCRCSPSGRRRSSWRSSRARTSTTAAISTSSVTRRTCACSRRSAGSAISRMTAITRTSSGTATPPAPARPRSSRCAGTTGRRATMSPSWGWARGSPGLAICCASRADIDDVCRVPGAEELRQAGAARVRTRPADRRPAGGLRGAPAAAPAPHGRPHRRHRARRRTRPRRRRAGRAPRRLVLSVPLRRRSGPAGLPRRGRRVAAPGLLLRLARRSRRRSRARVRRDRIRRADPPARPDGVLRARRPAVHHVPRLWRNPRHRGRHRAGRRHADLHPQGRADRPLPRSHLRRLPGGIGSRPRGAGNMTDARVALVTGGGTGIGAACCRALAAEGFRVVVHYRGSEAAAQAVARELESAFTVRADLAEPADVEALVGAIKDLAGRLDVLVNNAGRNRNAPTATMTLDDYDAVSTLARGTWYLTKLVLRRFMLRQGSGRIINITSVVGHTGNQGQAPYTMAKAGLDALTKSLALELAGRSILVNSVAPGFIATDMTATLPEAARDDILSRVPLGRMGTPEEVADVVAFLATHASYVHGTVVHVNGGLYGG